MNKAFVREPDSGGRAYCPRCKTLGVPVGAGPMDTHIRAESRSKLGDAAWFCGFARCDVAYYNEFEVVVTVDELKAPIYPFDLDAPLCACFGLTYDDIEADVRDGTPTRLRELLAKAKSPQARCETLAADGQSCVKTAQELYLRLRAQAQAK